KKLLIGHFSARYRELDPLLAEAKTIFPNTFLAIEGMTFEI
ncbi:MAG: ribonuclease Z, partial [Daejeonella sp.]